MPKIYYQEDCNLSLLEGKTIAVISLRQPGTCNALNKGVRMQCNRRLYGGSRSWKKAQGARIRGIYSS